MMTEMQRDNDYYEGLEDVIWKEMNEAEARRPKVEKTHRSDRGWKPADKES